MRFKRSCNSCTYVALQRFVSGQTLCQRRYQSNRYAANWENRWTCWWSTFPERDFKSYNVEWLQPRVANFNARGNIRIMGASHNAEKGRNWLEIWTWSFARKPCATISLDFARSKLYCLATLQARVMITLSRCDCRLWWTHSERVCIASWFTATTSPSINIARLHWNSWTLKSTQLMLDTFQLRHLDTEV